MKLTFSALSTLAFSVAISTSGLVTAKELSQEVIRNTSREIDKAIHAANSKKGIESLPLVDDATFLRRSYLNIIGRIPTLDETRNFLNNNEANKRSQLIDSLVYSQGFNSHMFNFYANMLRLQTNHEQSGAGWHLWLEESIATNKPYDQMVYEMLSAEGHTVDNPAVGYYLRDRDMLLDNISNTAQVFLGTQIGCAQCHDHPFEDWTQKQYYKLAAYGAGIEYRSDSSRNKIMEVIAHKQGPAMKDQKNNKQMEARKHNMMRREARDLGSLFQSFRRNEITVAESKSLKLPDDYQYNDGKPGDVVTPAVLFGSMPELKADSPPQHQLAAWVTAKENPMFSKVIANRLWKHALGYGLVEPIDNWTEHSNVSHPEVLDILVKVLHATDFDTRETLRVIYHTTLFQRETYAQAVDGGATHDFRGPLLRRMSAEEIHDSLLTLELGNVDGRKNQNLVNQWAQLQDSVHALLEAKPEDIIKLNSITDKAEASSQKYRTEASRLRRELTEAQGNGETAKAKEIQAKLTAAYRKVREIRESSTDDPAMANMMVKNNIRVRTRSLLRASALPSPHAPGSFTRDFGAADREITNSQHTSASIPQALTMLNGTEIARITDKNGILADALKKAESPRQRLNVLFLSIYNSYPSAQETERLEPLVKEASDIAILAKAMLNSKRFFFVQ